jgi:hypothetical protein
VAVEFSGPLFDGGAQQQLDGGADAAEQQLATVARDRVREEIRRRARVRTGYYESRVQVENTGGGDPVVDASGVIYDDWLERGRWRGSSFGGYRQWNVARAEVDAKATSLVERALAPYIDKMG